MQLGVFRSEANAIALKKRFIETLGDKIGSEVSIRSTNGLYKVVAGKSMTEQQAKICRGDYSRCVEHQSVYFEGIEFMLKKIYNKVTHEWDTSVEEALKSFIRLPALSPDF